MLSHWNFTNFFSKINMTSIHLKTVKFISWRESTLVLVIFFQKLSFTDKFFFSDIFSMLFVDFAIKNQSIFLTARRCKQFHKFERNKQLMQKYCMYSAKLQTERIPKDLVLFLRMVLAGILVNCSHKDKRKSLSIHDVMVTMATRNHEKIKSI